MSTPDQYRPTLFCPLCGQYAGRADYCAHCRVALPDAVPPRDEPHWAIPLAAAPAGVWHAMRTTDDRPAAIGADQTGRIHAITPAGQPLWPAQPLPGRPRSQTLLHADRLVVTLRGGQQLFGIAVSDGVQTPLATVADGRPQAPAAGGDALYAGDDQGHIWRIAAGRGAIVGNIGSAASGAPAVRGDTVFMPTVHGTLHAWDARNRRAAWRGPHALPHGGGRVHLLLTDDTLIVVSPSGAVELLDPVNGTPRHARLQLGAPVTTAPQLAAGRVLVGGDNGNLYTIDLAGGAPSVNTVEIGHGQMAAVAAGRDGLAYAATRAGNLLLLDVTAGRALHSRRLPAGEVTMLLAADDRLYVGQRSVTNDAGRLTAWPWHLGAWEAVAEWAHARANHALAAPFFALANAKERAADCWLQSDQPNLAGEYWWGLSRDSDAAGAFFCAADKLEGELPAKAGGIYHRAATCYSNINDHANAATARERAGRQAGFAALTVDAEPFVLGTFEVGRGGNLAVRVRNVGNRPATDVRFALGGELAVLVEAPAKNAPPLTLAAGADEVIQFENLIPTRAGDQTLVLAFKYGDAGYTPQRFALHVEPGPDIEMMDDVGGVIMRLAPGERIPRVRVRGMAGTVKIDARPRHGLTLNDEAT